LGGIQPSIMNSLYNEDHKSSGFLDRMLVCYPETEVEYWNTKNISEKHIDFYKDVMTNFYQKIRSNIERSPDNGEIIYDLAIISKEAETDQIRYYNKLTDNQKSDESDEYTKSIFPKQKNYLFRFALLIHVFDSFINIKKIDLVISKESILKAEKLCDYFIKMATKVNMLKEESSQLSTIIKKHKETKTTKEIIALINESNPNFNKKELAELLKVSKRYIYKIIKND